MVQFEGKKKDISGQASLVKHVVLWGSILFLLILSPLELTISHFLSHPSSYYPF
jgi:hypothetical protein